MHSALNHASKMFQSSVDVVWKWCHSSFKGASKMFEDVFKVERVRSNHGWMSDKMNGIFE